MAFYSLPLEKRNDKVDEKFLYLEIAKFNDDYLKSDNGKKLSKDELKTRKTNVEAQVMTLRQLETGHFNSYNRPIALESIFDFSFPSAINNMDKYVIYRIQPTALIQSSGGYYSNLKYDVYEFNVVAKLTTKEQVIKQVHDDGLLKEFSANYFDQYNYGNEGFKENLIDYFKYIKENYPDFTFTISDLLLNTKEYGNPARRFCSNMYNNTRETIKHLLDNEFIAYYYGDWYPERILNILLDCELYEIALNYVMLVKDIDYKLKVQKSKEINLSLKKCSTNEFVKQIILFLEIHLTGVTLKIKKYDEWHDDTFETKQFENIGQVKQYLIKTYDVSFEQAQKTDISDIRAGEDFEGYSFSIE